MTLEQNVTITGLQEVQAAQAKIIAEMKPTGAVGKGVRHIVTALHRYSTAIIHVDTGALRASNRMSVELGAEARGQIYIDPSGRNPRGVLVGEYAEKEELRGGSHGYYDRTIRERGVSASVEAGKMILEAMPRGD